MQVQQKHWIQCLFLSMVPVWKEICCASFFSTKFMLVSYVVIISISFTNTTKLSKATNTVVCFLRAKAQKEQKINSAEC